jgi:gamma-D-glutamyl-L-lysine dipeptidyl-peptidase
MNRMFLALWMCGMLAAVTVNGQTDTTVYKNLAEEVRQKYAPDKRSVFFRTIIKSDSLIIESTSEAALKEYVQSVKTLKGLKVVQNLLPDSSLGAQTYGVATLSVTNNRSNPRNSAEMVTQLVLGTPVQILKKEGPFYLVRSPDGYLSYTDRQAIALMDLERFKRWQTADKVIFTADAGHAYSESSVKSSRVSDLVAGNILEVKTKQGKFYQVAFPDGRLGYVEKGQLQSYKDWIDKPDPKANDILAAAKTMIGVPYLWGGTSVKGVDCSGFTKTSYFLNGIIIPRDASQQVLVGTAVDIMDDDKLSTEKCLKNLQPGDLLFFSASRRRGIAGGRVTHTAIYMGDGEFIQSAGMVMISSLLPEAANYDRSQVPTIVGARRFLNNIGKPEITRIDKHQWYTGD